MIPALLAILGPIIGKVIDRLPDPAARTQARLEVEEKLHEQETELLKLFTAVDQGQLEVNKVEAANASLFVSGWRPFIGWVCGIGLAWAFVLEPVVKAILAVYAPTVVLPVIAVGELSMLVSGMLGMGAIRSYEKIRGVAAK